MHRGPFCSTSAHSSGTLPFCNFSAYGYRFFLVSSRRARCTDIWRTGPSRAYRLVVSSATSKARSSVTSALVRAKQSARTVPARSCCSALAPISCTATTGCLVRCVNHDASLMHALNTLRRSHIEWVPKERLSMPWKEPVSESFEH